MSDPQLQPQPAPLPGCYRHPEKAASVLCAHCDRPICTDCMVEAPVGWQCPRCTSEGAKRSRHVPAFTHTSRGRTGVVGSTNPTPIVLTLIAVNVVVFFLERFGTNVTRRRPLRPMARRGAFPAPVLPGLHRDVAARQLLAHLLQHDHAPDRRPRPRGAPGQGALPHLVPARRARRERRFLPPRSAQRARLRGVGRHHGRPGRLRRRGVAPPTAGGAGGGVAGHHLRVPASWATRTGGPTSAAW